MRVLVTGGAGYIGSHTCVELLNNNHEVIVYDNLANSCEKSLERVKQITKKDLIFIKGDILDKNHLEEVFSTYQIDCVINFAGLKAVGESVRIPLDYYNVNITGAINILSVMQKHNCFKFIFSSSATVYGDPEIVPVDENSRIGGTTNPYGTTKLYIEQILQDLYKSDPRFQICILRYFNPIGAHPSGLIGEDPNDIPNNLAPYITQVMVGKRECLTIFGDDYSTPDGTCIRDYIHVCDLAYGHVCAINKLNENPGLVIYNLGTGNGSSVYDILYAFEKAYGKPIPYKVGPRRDGDIAVNYTKVDKALNELDFKAKYNIFDMARDQWNWQKNNPNGYKD